MDVSVASFILLSILTLEAGNSLINPAGCDRDLVPYREGRRRVPSVAGLGAVVGVAR